jgi:hypothetical protein
MKKGQGLAVGALIAAGLLIRPAVPVTAEHVEPSKTEISLPGRSASGEGPWAASCDYWSPTREPEDPPSASLAESNSNLDEEDGHTTVHLEVNVTNTDQAPGCRSEPGKRWGFPKDRGLHVTAIIATVPDPIHSHLALAFDRTVDATLQAATDNNYVSSYYWLPWRDHPGDLKPARDQGDAEPGHDPERERRPGLVILKSVPPEDADSAVLSNSYYNVIYLFLVAETPTKGVDGFQLRNAFSYEAELQSELGGRFSMGKNGAVAIIGPGYSGSAASLRAGIETAQLQNPSLKTVGFEIAGTTSTAFPVKLLSCNRFTDTKIKYSSFENDSAQGTNTLVDLLQRSGYDPRRVALLIEDNTALGSARAHAFASQGATSGSKVPEVQPQVIRFPREISLLRNTQSTVDQTGNTAPAVPSPYLHLSLKDSSAQDSVPQFSREETPLSQEAQLMTIARQLHRMRSQFIEIVASNELDQLFLMQFLHRACPDARLVFLGGDLLMVREIDNIPYIGSVTITPYPLIGLSSATGLPVRAYSNSSSLAYYNAVSYTLWGVSPQKTSNENLVSPVAKLDGGRTPLLQGYRSPLDPDIPHPALWATVIGSDGYYPLGIVSPCASKNPSILPAIDTDGKLSGESCEARAMVLRSSTLIYPSLLWVVLCTLVCLLCTVHIVMLLIADYWSPLTRDLAVRDNDQPRRRSMYVHVATATLFAMTIVVSFPLMSLGLRISVNLASMVASFVVFGFGVLTVITALWKTRGHRGWIWPETRASQRPARFLYAYRFAGANSYQCFNLVAWTTMIAFPLLWGYLCLAKSTVGAHSGSGLYLVGLSFSYRCINPGSGVSPVVPVLLLPFTWYLWGFFQTWRLRFSENGRPWLPEKIQDECGGRLFVSDNELRNCQGRRDCCLYRNITCLLITRELLCRFWRFRGRGQKDTAKRQGVHADIGVGAGFDDCVAVDIALVVAYGCALVWFSLFTRLRGMDHFLWNSGQYLSSPYELLVSVLFFPLIVMSLAGLLRMIMIWTALKRGLLERLENLPIRFAFGRLKSVGWMTILRHGGLREQWRDMARCLESMRQMLHQADLKESMSEADRLRLNAANSNLLGVIAQLRERVEEPADRRERGEHDYDFVKKIELEFATFSKELLSTVLIPYWKDERIGLVESDVTEAEHLNFAGKLRAEPTSAQPARVLVAEEFLAIRYMSLIRAVLANMRYLMMFVSVSFVLAIMAWNSYPFQPRQEINWFFTGLLALLGSGVIWVFAQMHRNPILSRITDTSANELGWDFYLRVVSFGAFPVLAWLGYQFPDIGSVIYKFIQPGVSVIK